MAIKDFDHFTDHLVFIDGNVDPMFGSSLFSLTGSKWRDMRAALSPVFTGSKMRQMFECVSNCGANMAKSILKETNQKGPQTHAMKDIFTRFTNDVIASSAFGIDVNSFEDKDNEFYKLGLRVADFTSFATFLKFLGYTTMPWIIADNFRIRESQNIVRHDLIQLLLQLRKGGTISAGEEPVDNLIDEGFSTVQESDIGKRTVQRKWNDEELIWHNVLYSFWPDLIHPAHCCLLLLTNWP
jgi:cytochrome P450 family 9